MAETYKRSRCGTIISHFTHNYKGNCYKYQYEAETGTSSQPGMHGFLLPTQTVSALSLLDEVTSDLRRGTPTPAFTGGTPTHPVVIRFTGWEPSVAATVTDNAVYTAQWKLDEAYAGLNRTDEPFDGLCRR